MAPSGADPVAVVRAYVERVLDGRDLGALPGLVAEDYASDPRLIGPTAAGRDAFAQRILNNFAFLDARYGAPVRFYFVQGFASADGDVAVVATLHGHLGAGTVVAVARVAEGRITTLFETYSLR